jgi:hypothetical protein
MIYVMVSRVIWDAIRVTNNRVADTKRWRAISLRYFKFVIISSAIKLLLIRDAVPPVLILLGLSGRILAAGLATCYLYLHIWPSGV